MIYRQLWVSYIETTALSIITSTITYRAADITKTITSHGGLTGALFRHENLLYGYLESTQPIDLHTLWDHLLGDMLLPVPSVHGPRVAIELPDIYHDGVPGDGPHWRAPGYTPQKRVGSLARIKPDMYCSYVYYHFLRQEEIPHGFNKYYIIGAHEFQIFSYQEWPATVDEPKPKGSFDSQITPKNWQELMHIHFDLWPNQPKETQEWIRLPLLWEL
ncbi:MAG: hypothetical protein DWI30_02845 [Chloroflexi bacterium]|jgi:hypothetical protein|nr:MAG: hypothetical protein DWI30_02845 [Chloroflexota bacterium]